MDAITYPQEHISRSPNPEPGWRVAIPLKGGEAAVVVRTPHNRSCEEERTLHRISDVIPQMIMVQDVAGKPIYANRAALEYTGATAEDVLSPDFRERIFHPEDIARLREERARALERGAPFEIEQRARRHDGTYHWLWIRYDPFLDEHGQLVRWYATATAIEERKRAEARDRNEYFALRQDGALNATFENVIGSSESIKRVLKQLSKVAPTNSTVLILGETGTGKELIAQAIHRRSARAARPFVRVNCAAIPVALIASELFGHEKGAFTGAVQRRVGRFEAAHGGTIFLDEVGELPAETQIALLRVLQEREFERVGGTQTIPVDVRVVAATNRNLCAAVEAGTFREDLFYRLNVIPLRLPPLRERKGDVRLLTEYFIARYAAIAGKQLRRINRETLELFESYRWPGNIRELQNVVERGVILCEGDTFYVEEAWLAPGRSCRCDAARGPCSIGEPGDERERIEAVLRETNGRIAGPLGAAVRLRMPRQTLESKMRRLGINSHTFKKI